MILCGYKAVGNGEREKGQERVAPPRAEIG